MLWGQVAGSGRRFNEPFHFRESEDLPAFENRLVSEAKKIAFVSQLFPNSFFGG